MIEVILCVANAPDLNGDVYTPEMLQKMAEGDERLRVEGDRLIGLFPTMVGLTDEIAKLGHELGFSWYAEE